MIEYVITAGPGILLEHAVCHRGDLTDYVVPFIRAGEEVIFSTVENGRGKEFFHGDWGC